VHVVATAGHVDHGKSTLVQALTGIDPDRWEEEKRRGLTIDLGFAWLTLPSGRVASFIDVPGHVRFLRNMLAGVGAVDACLLVVDVNEGWMPQTEEHVRILEVLGLSSGLVVLTKAGSVDRDTVDLVGLQVADRTAGTFLDGAPVVVTDAIGRIGLDELASALDQLLEHTPTAADRGRPRLWVDRAFAATGAGTVVTGTLTGGRLAVGDELELHPGARPARVRGLQTHKAAIDGAVPGSRVAVNLVGVHHSEVIRGDALVRPGQWHVTRHVDAELTVLAGLDHSVSRRGAFLAYVGAAEHPVSIRVVGAEEVAPGGTGVVRLHLPVELPLLPGDRYVLRDSGRDETVGGGEIVDVDPVLPASRAHPNRSVDRVVAERGWVDTDELERLTGERRPASLGTWVVDPAALEVATRSLRQRVEEAGSLGLDMAMLDERERALTTTIDDVVVDAGRVRLVGADPLAGHPWPEALASAPFTPPAADGIDPQEVRELVRRGRVVERDGVYFAPSAIIAAAEAVTSLLDAQPDGVTVAEVRDRLGTSRKYVLPLLNELDHRGITRRRGDVRVAGPRARGNAG
jgi:selenocysteine-specific elongation factor